MTYRELNLTFQRQEINIKLPKHYFKTNEATYPLVIVQDGDYLFKDIEHDVIFVGIVANNRNQDYTPWESTVNDIEYGGQAQDYVTWVADVLIPYLRKCFRISHNRDEIGIAGASFGGLVSLYALFKRPDVFGNYIFISPSVWYPQFIDFMKSQSIIRAPQHVYWYVGHHEGKQSNHLNRYMVPRTEQAVEILNELLVSEQSEFYFVTDRKGIHRKRYFKKYFNKAINKLF
ncbi:alpha/beta hydrolase [Staphylococcus edaphicus]|uniref:Alpha/beta hydrolase-fold protein n=1 Tax=Staphylococcus edaphicus TaxID=1955013 RepID=A0A2C6WDJ4_9STAP|nr:alpha/beta hydrolase-fold protein [Staphylococcus edaphicus]PHK48898.1 esterase [Staphylococcus edaphicus]UQW81874.1 alpha/beta hydrolase-fold protein [Staphylococcus edaphicus]